MKLPPKLYKYQPYTVQALDNLKNRGLWFSKPSRFNDSFDCAIHFEIAYQTAKDWENLFNKYRTEVSDKKGFDKKYLIDKQVNQLFKDDAMKGLNRAFQERVEIMRNQRGVACFSEVVDNILMWAHYADGHRGFCLEFDTNNIHFSKAFPVVYSDFLPTMHLTKVLVQEDDDNNLMGMVTTKSNLWSYEKEWRLFHKEGDKKYGVGVEALTGIYFGCEMPFVHKEIISLVLDNSLTKLYEMKKVEGKFKLDFHSVEYTPYSKRKKLVSIILSDSKASLQVEQDSLPRKRPFADAQGDMLYCFTPCITRTVSTPKITVPIPNNPNQSKSVSSAKENKLM